MGRLDRARDICVCLLAPGLEQGAGRPTPGPCAGGCDGMTGAWLGMPLKPSCLSGGVPLCRNEKRQMSAVGWVLRHPWPSAGRQAALSSKAQYELQYVGAGSESGHVCAGDGQRF